jgi:hypothetical protein
MLVAPPLTPRRGFLIALQLHGDSCLSGLSLGWISLGWIKQKETQIKQQTSRKRKGRGPSPTVSPASRCTVLFLFFWGGGTYKKVNFFGSLLELRPPPSLLILCGGGCRFCERMLDFKAFLAVGPPSSAPSVTSTSARAAGACAICNAVCCSNFTLCSVV